MMFVSDRQAVLIGGPREAPRPLEAIAEAFKGNQSPLKQSPEMVKLLATVDMKSPIWGALHVTPAYRQGPLLASMEWMTLSGTAEGNVMKFRFDAKGQNEAAAREAVGMVSQGVGQLKGMLQDVSKSPEAEMEGLKDMLTTAKNLVDSIKVSTDAADATKATLTGQLDAPPQSLMATVFGFFGTVMAPRQHDPAVEVAPAVRDVAEPELKRPAPVPLPPPQPAPRP